MQTSMKASDFIAHFLRAQQTTHVFEVAGGMITHILDSIYHHGNLDIISVHHEQAASFAADAYGRFTGRPGIALATSGPGATNLLTGIGSCYFDSSPALFITGQVNTHEQKGSRSIRQLGFQETDILSMAKPITKGCFAIENTEHFESTFYEAYALAMNGRPGPVLIDIPMNLQRAEIQVKPVEYIERQTTKTQTAIDFSQLTTDIKKAQRPLILVGQGVTCARASTDLIHFAQTVNIPVVTSLLALDTIPITHPLRIGMIGSYGNRWANLALGHSDLVIVIGSRLDIRQTGADVEGFSANKIIYHIDIDQHEINNRVKNCIPIVCDAKSFLEQASAFFKDQQFKTNTQWLGEIKALSLQWSDLKELKDFSGINPNFLMHELSSAAKKVIGYTADVGNHQMWAGQSLHLQANQGFITSGGMGAMGFSIPAAIGYSLAAGKKPVVVIVGDGSFQMNIQELQTIVRNKLPIKIVVLNNQALGMIRQFQDSYFEGRYQSTYWGYSAPNFCAIAQAYGITSKNIMGQLEVKEAMGWLFDDLTQPGLLEVMISPYMNVYPKIAFGKPITEMEPFATPLEMEGT